MDSVNSTENASKYVYSNGRRSLIHTMYNSKGYERINRFFDIYIGSRSSPDVADKLLKIMSPATVWSRARGTNLDTNNEN